LGLVRESRIRPKPEVRSTLGAWLRTIDVVSVASGSLRRGRRGKTNARAVKRVVCCGVASVLGSAEGKMLRLIEPMSGSGSVCGGRDWPRLGLGAG